MSLSNVFGIAGSAMNAQTIRLNTTASNMANADSVSSSLSMRLIVLVSPFLRFNKLIHWHNLIMNQALLQARALKCLGIVESQADLRQEYNPAHPMADEQRFCVLPECKCG